MSGAAVPSRNGGRRGRRPGSADTRGRIVSEARGLFAERGFDGATVREVAARAHVDGALVHHYFGTKQQLFVAVMQFPVEIGEVVPAVLGGPRDGMGERFVRFVIGLWDRPDVRTLLTGVVRSASTDRTAATMVRRMLVEGPLLALATAIETPDAQMRAAIAGSHLFGIAMARYVIGVEPIASMAPDELAAVVGPAIERYLVGELGTAGEARRPA